MGKGCRSENSNIYYQARKEAAKYNENLYSRENASELIGVSVSTLADYELGNIKSVPPDKVNLMAEMYQRPDLRMHYCKYDCPLGKYHSVATEIKSIEEVTLHLHKCMKIKKIKEIKDKLVEIAVGGQMSEDEIPMLEEITRSLDEMSIAISEMKLLVGGIRNGGKQNE